jgi:osmoprotectant transport system ATP-binding protein
VTVALEAEALHHAYGATATLRGVSLQVHTGSLLAIVGESGSGKSTLLRCFNRLTEPTSGVARVAGVDARRTPAEQLRRHIGFVPQSGGLLPHWSVLRNAALVPRLIGQSSPEAAAARALTLVGLPPEEFGARLPYELSGGQRQRVALARALAARQDIVLLDEPFGALDALSRAVVHEAFEQVRRELGFTAVLVTHDLAEAARLADEIAVMRAGVIEQIGTLAMLQRAPATAYVAELLQHATAAARPLVALAVAPVVAP